MANAFEQRLNAMGVHTYFFQWRQCAPWPEPCPGFTDENRVENIRRVAEVAESISDTGLVAMTAFIAPFKAERQLARGLIGEDRLIEVYVDSTLHIAAEVPLQRSLQKSAAGRAEKLHWY